MAKNYNDKKRRAGARFLCFLLALAMLSGIAVYIFILIGNK